MKTNVLILAFLLLSLVAAAQGRVTLNVAQDVRLAAFKDSQGRDPFTLDITIRSEWQGLEKKGYYIFIAPEFEFARLRNTYRRYSANGGITLIYFPRFPLTASVGYGITTSRGAYISANGNLQAGFVINNLTLFADLQIVDRKDIGAVRASGFLGIKYNLK